MPFYVQYDNDGLITGTVVSATPPEHPLQLEFDSFVETNSKKVNLQTLELEDYTPPPDEPTQEDIDAQLTYWSAKKAALEK